MQLNQCGDRLLLLAATPWGVLRGMESLYAGNAAGCSAVVRRPCLSDWCKDGVLQLLRKAIDYPAASRPQQGHDCSLSCEMSLSCE